MSKTYGFMAGVGKKKGNPALPCTAVVLQTVYAKNVMSAWLETYPYFVSRIIQDTRWKAYPYYKIYSRKGGSING